MRLFLRPFSYDFELNHHGLLLSNAFSLLGLGIIEDSKNPTFFTSSADSRQRRVKWKTAHPPHIAPLQSNVVRELNKSEQEMVILTNILQRMMPML